MGLADIVRLEFKHAKRLKGKWLPFRLPRWALWTFAMLTVVVYAALFYYVFVSPFSIRWKGLFGRGAEPSGYSIRGIDVSHYQGSIDWKSLKQAEIGDDPVSFVIIKATEGTDFLDENFYRNQREAREEGFICGAYHFFLPSEPAEAQARYFLRNVHLAKGDMPPVLDIEHKGELTSHQIKRAALTWLRIVEHHYDVKPIIYTNYNFKMKYLSDSVFDEYPYWIAHYYVDTLKYEGAWKLWQYTDNGRLDGIKGTVDFDLYNGSMYDLQQMLIGSRRNDQYDEEGDEGLDTEQGLSMGN